MEGLQVARGGVDEGERVRAWAALAGAALDVVDGDLVRADVGPAQAHELFDALAPGQQVQVQALAAQVRELFDQPPVDAQFVGGERVLVRAVEAPSRRVFATGLARTSSSAASVCLARSSASVAAFAAASLRASTLRWSC